MSCDTNFITAKQFKVVLDKFEFPLTAFYTVGVNLPSVTTQSAIAKFRGKTVHQGGESIEFEPLSLRILLDENLNVYKELFNWMIKAREAKEEYTRDLTLITLTNKNNESEAIFFKDVHPTNIASVPFDVQNQSSEYLSIDVTFDYTEFSFK